MRSVAVSGEASLYLAGADKGTSTWCAGGGSRQGVTIRLTTGEINQLQDLLIRRNDMQQCYHPLSDSITETCMV